LKLAASESLLQRQPAADMYRDTTQEDREKEFMMADDPSMRARWDVVDLRTLVRYSPDTKHRQTSTAQHLSVPPERRFPVTGSADLPIL
jgi:hypothetical protein